LAEGSRHNALAAETEQLEAKAKFLLGAIQSSQQSTSLLTSTELLSRTNLDHTLENNRQLEERSYQY
jgi:hypothetical protein